MPCRTLPYRVPCRDGIDSRKSCEKVSNRVTHAGCVLDEKTEDNNPICDIFGVYHHARSTAALVEGEKFFMHGVPQHARGLDIKYNKRQHRLFAKFFQPMSLRARSENIDITSEQCTTVIFSDPEPL